ncbi:origin recognition complex subunit 2-domain-containing protein, partial [Syncephalis fuscata]
MSSDNEANPSSDQPQQTIMVDNEEIPAYIFNLCNNEDATSGEQIQQTQQTQQQQTPRRRGPRRIYGKGLAQSFTADIVTNKSGRKISRALSNSQSDGEKENLDYDPAENDLLPSRQLTNKVNTKANLLTEKSSKSINTNDKLKRKSRKSVASTPIDTNEQTTMATNTATRMTSMEPSSTILTDIFASNNNNNQDIDDEAEDAPNTDAYYVGASTSRFFLARGGSNRTSNNTMASLPPLERSEFTTLIHKVQPSHEEEMTHLQQLYKKQFNQWFFELRSGFSLLVYGFGSKRSLMHRFAREMLTDGPLIVVNGFSPIVSPKEILEKIMSVLPDGARSAGTLLDQARHLTDYLAGLQKKPLSTSHRGSKAKATFKHIYLLIHNIECSGLQSERARAVLSTLAKSSHIYCMATIDHIHSGFLWDSSSMAQFKWIAHDTTTFEPYYVEISYENSLLAKSEEMDGKAARYVLSSLTVNARGLFRLLAEYQLKHKDRRPVASMVTTQSKPSRGRPRKTNKLSPTEEENEEEEYMQSNGDEAITRDNTLSSSTSFGYLIEGFLVSNDLTFRTQLTEFRDHRLMLTRRSNEGEDLFYIPFSNVTLNSLVQALDNFKTH